ncbi:MAG: protein kinase [Candidatus Manganitrophus sp.]|nr:protein kinase [Candidatus Manganitrophus sp.]WDT72067.1 MAG: protein kinase [Candidatus Manganitrophus sp.]WDT80529.1 MAG: protein kinase [Candidatus Manganitrophus sp.]
MNQASWRIDLSRLSDDPVLFLQQWISDVSKPTLVGYLSLFFLIAIGIPLARRYFSMRPSTNTYNPLKEAKEAAKSRDPYRAAELFEQAGEYEEAIRLYKEGKAYQQVGRIFELKKQWQESAQFYKLSGDTEKAAVMYQKGGEYVRAAECYLTCKKISLAAEAYEKAKRFKEAAKQYEKFGNLLKAATLYDQANDPPKAAEMYEKYFLREKRARSGPASEKTNQIAQAAFQSGQIYMKLKQFPKAVEILTAGGFALEAAEAAVQGGETEKAAELFLTAKAFDRAASLYEQIGDTRRGNRVVGKKFQEEGKFLPAAEAFERGESWVEAAELYERIGDKAKAGEMLMKNGDYHRAGDLYLSVGDMASAAQALEKGGRFREAADLYMRLQQFDKAAQMQESGGNYYDAALLYKQQGKFDQSISYLQKIDSQSSEYHQASLLLGQLLVERGMIDAARERYQKIISQETIGPENLEFYYQLALLHEKQKEFEEAQNLYERILAEDYSYRDAKSRSTLLKRALTEVKKVLDATRIEEATARPVAAPVQPTTSRYKIVKKIGQGGMGVVYQAEDTLLKRLVAYKVLPAAIRENEAMLQSFLQEARIAAALNHPNVVTIFDTGKNGDEIFITMEYVNGITLKEYLEKNETSIPKLVEIMKEICVGVSYAHSKNVVHRDLKPANVMLTHDHRVKIMDFGLAKVVSETAADKTSVKGTPLYMAPEQILGEKVDHQSDIYSLGCTFYRMVAGRPPFVQGDVYYHHLHTLPAHPRTLNPKLSEALDRLIMKTIEKEKSKRYKKVTEIIEDLGKLA